MKQLEIIRRAIEEHHKIRTDLQATGGAINDFSAIFSLQNAGTQLGQSSFQDVTHAVDNLKTTIDHLDTGIQKHFGFEEKYLPDVLGKNLMDALLLEHMDIKDRMLKCTTSFLAEVSNASREELLSYRTVIQQNIDDLTGHIESHAGKEDIIFGMIEKALSSKRDA